MAKGSGYANRILARAYLKGYGSESGGGRGGFGSGVISYAKNRLSAPQFQEFISALAGKTSKSTQSYWREKASTFKEIIEEG